MTAEQRAVKGPFAGVPLFFEIHNNGPRLSRDTWGFSMCRLSRSRARRFACSKTLFRKNTTFGLILLSIPHAHFTRTRERLSIQTSRPLPIQKFTFGGLLPDFKRALHNWFCCRISKNQLSKIKPRYNRADYTRFLLYK